MYQTDVQASQESSVGVAISQIEISDTASVPVLVADTPPCPDPGGWIGGLRGRIMGVGQDDSGSSRATTPGEAGAW